jgi:hypothetical protein
VRAQLLQTKENQRKKKKKSQFVAWVVELLSLLSFTQGRAAYPAPCFDRFSSLDCVHNLFHVLLSS